MKALIAMSGGVDSSVAALLTKESGYDCIGCTMKLWDLPEEDAGAVKPSKTCCSLDDTEDARSVAYRLGMPFYAFNYKDEFMEKVICPFAESYEQGRTPNPCVECNRFLKFGKLYARAKELGCEKIVTGHYARIEQGPDGKYLLKKGLDPSKDQSYVLHCLTQEQLAHTLFPLGEYTKEQARSIAAEHGFVNANKPDSQDICFVPDGDYAKVVQRYGSGEGTRPGAFVDLQGDPIGTHKGLIHYTIGQRKGLGNTWGKPVFVCAIDAAANTVTLGDSEDLFETRVEVKDFNWIAGEAPKESIRCTAKLRYRQKETPATATVREDGRVILTFDEPQRAPTPGQYAVLYDGDIVLGGGTIETGKRLVDL
ncbi:MAG: tRNA 2-thiouridine(34) synthase MnmA [Firmicutes bacterium]|nr:tRNA 2-thiouridine(34) synthase MnmA [Bacillota bacterium]